MSSLMVSSQEGQAMEAYKRNFEETAPFHLYLFILVMLSDLHLGLEVGGETVVAEGVAT